MSTLSDQAEANCREWSEAGYEKDEDWSNQLRPHFNRLLELIELKYEVKHPEWHEHRIKVPDTEIGSEMFLEGGKPVWKDCLMPSHWVPSWMVRLVQYERRWRRECAYGSATADEHDDIIQALHEGLSGNLSQVEAFLGLKELANDYKYEHGLYVAPDLATRPAPAIDFASDPNTGMYRSSPGQISICVGGTQFMTLDEVRAANGLPPLEEE